MELTCWPPFSSGNKSYPLFSTCLLPDNHVTCEARVCVVTISNIMREDRGATFRSALENTFFTRDETSRCMNFVGRGGLDPKQHIDIEDSPLRTPNTDNPYATLSRCLGKRHARMLRRGERIVMRKLTGSDDGAAVVTERRRKFLFWTRTLDVFIQL